MSVNLQKASLRKYQANAAKIVPADYHPNFADLVPVATPPTALQSPNKWFEFLSPDNDFKLSAPGQLVNAEPTRDVVPNVIFKLKESENPYGVYFHVKRLDFPHGTLAGLPSTILDSALNAARDKDVSAIQGQLVGDSPVSLESYPGREIRFSAEAGSILATERMYIVGDHLYLILAIRKPSEEADSAVTRFLNSFRLITQPR